MKRATKEEQEQLLSDFARSAESYLKEVGCIREADNVEPIWASTKDICEAIGAAQSMWYSIREKIIELGIPLSLAYFGGYYIGKDGEQATLMKHKESMIRGLARSYNDDIITMARDGRTMEEVEKYARQRLAMDLKDVPKILRALGNPLPSPLELRLIEASKKVYDDEPDAE